MSTVEDDNRGIKGQLQAEYFIPLLALTTALIAASLSADSILFIIELGVAVLLVQWRWPWGAVVALFLAAGMSGYTINLFNLTIRPEQVAVLVLLPATMLCHEGWKGEWSDNLLAGFIGMNFLSSAISSPVSAASIKHATGQSLAVVSYWLVRRLAKEYDQIVAVFLAVGVAGAIFGILCYGSHYLLGTEMGIMYYPASAVRAELPSVQGSQVEANIFGSYVASFAAIFFSLYMKLEKRQHLIACIVCFAATAVSLARAAWLGLAVAVAFVVVSELAGGARRKSMKRSLIVTLLATSIGLILWYSVGSLPERAQSIAPETILEDPTLAHRIYHATLALDDASVKPWLGWGTDSFELMREEESRSDQKGAWIPNVSVRVLHDTGLVGVVLLFSFFVVLGWKAWRSREPVARALLAGSIVLMVAFQFSDATVLAYPWMLFGLLTAASSARPEGRASVTLRAV